MEKLISILAVLVAIVAVGLSIFAVQTVGEVVVPSADEIASKVNVTVIIPEVENSDLEEFLNDSLKDKRELELKNETAKNLTLDEASKKAFRVALFDLLVDEGRDVESYKDVVITSVKVEKSEVSGEDAVVELEVRVSFIEFGDEEESFKAVVKAVFEVEDLDVDEDLEDAEASLDVLELLRVREN
jgi:hypothetical protein